MENPIYLGDAVYGTLDLETGSIILTTGTHLESKADDVIVLEPAVLSNLVEWMARIARDGGRTS